MLRKSKIIHIKEIGNVIFAKSGRSKYVNLRVRPFKGLTVSIPRWTSYADAEKVVRKRLSWIKEKLNKTKELERNFTVFDHETNFCTRNHCLNILPASVSVTSVRVIGNVIKVKYPRDSDVRNQDIQSAIRRGVEEALRKEAKEHMPIRVRELARRHNFVYNDVSVKSTKTRWGSCSLYNNLNFNIHLMRLPDFLIDYVILHELVHTAERNHSKNFWTLLNHLTGDAKKLDKELKKFKIQIY